MLKMTRLLLLFAIIWTGCDNDLDLVSPYKNIPVTYGLLNRSDTAQYIRVEKAFVDPTVSALILAKEPDSLYYPDLVVMLENLTTGTSHTLERVDGNLEGYPRDTGIFANSPNWMYKIPTRDLRMQAGDGYRIRIDRGEPFEEITATTSIIGDLEFVRPRAGSTIDFSGFGDFGVVWVGHEAAGFYDVTLYVYVSEWIAGSTDPKETVEIPWIIARSITEARVNISKREFFSLLANRLEEDPNVLRSLDSFKLEIKAGGKELFEFIKVSRANTGITASQEVPRVTNMSEGFGVFSSSNNSSESDFDITSATRDSLRTNSLTKALNFR